MSGEHAARHGYSMWCSNPSSGMRSATPKTIVRDAIAQAASSLDKPQDGEVVVLMTDDAAIQRLNATWRGLDKPTNVLSFPRAGRAGRRPAASRRYRDRL